MEQAIFKEKLKETEASLTKVIESFEKHITLIKTGSANVNLLNDVRIDYYGTLTPLNQIAALSTPEPNQILIKPYDRSMVKNILIALNKTHNDLTINEQNFMVRIVIPPLTEDRRKEYVKNLHQEAENYKVQVRNARRHYLQSIRNLHDGNKNLIEFYSEKAQTMTDKYIDRIKQITAKKEAQLLKI